MDSPGVRMGSTRGYSESDLDLCLAAEEDFEQVRSLYSEEIDYLLSVYHSWLQERDRMVILAKRNGQVVGAGSAHIVDDGQTALMEGFKVAESERDKGVARLIHKDVLQRVRARYPEVKKQSANARRKFFRGWHLLGKQSLISLRFPSINVPALVSEMANNMKKNGEGYSEAVSLQPDDVRSIFLNRSVIETVLPGGRIIQRGGVFKPLESNLDILLRRDIVWRADRTGTPHAVGLATAPYTDPVGNRVFDIDVFGGDLSAVKSVFLSQLQSLSPSQDSVICLLSVSPSLFPQMWEFCINEMGLERGKQYWEDSFIIEGDLELIRAKL